MASAILRIQQTFLPTIFGRNDVIKKRTLQVVLHRTSTSSFSDFRNPSLRLTYRSTILRLIYRSKEENLLPEEISQTSFSLPFIRLRKQLLTGIQFKGKIDMRALEKREWGLIKASKT